MTNSKKECTGSYSVSGYTRSDGTKVGEYTRTCWLHGNGGYASLDGAGFSIGTKPEDFEQKISDFDKKIEKLNNSDKIYDSDVDNIFQVVAVLVEALCKASENTDKKKLQLPEKIDKTCKKYGYNKSIWKQISSNSKKI